MENIWNKTKDIPIPYDKLDEIEVSYDGIDPDYSVEIMEKRTCMMAGSAGGFGYFGKGWGTNGDNGCDYGLICDEPEYWRFNLNIIT